MLSTLVRQDESSTVIIDLIISSNSDGENTSYKLLTKLIKVFSRVSYILSLTFTTWFLLLKFFVHVDMSAVSFP